ncbi:MAG TPA: tetraacyldisaccharide 4'-kinase [Pyrinomonadaceae bacterium]
MKPSVVLLPLNAIYSAVTRTRLAAYRRGWFPVSKLDATVISVGNLTTGGTGKTPLVEWLCRAIASARLAENSREAKRLCVLTRGYGRHNPKNQVVVSNGVELLAGAHEAGDEPFLLARNLLGIAAVVANPDRVAAGEWALKNFNTEYFVLDDGFQHLRLARDLNIVTIDATNPWGGGSLLPYGRLREPRDGLSRADCVVMTRTDQVEDLPSTKAAVMRLAGGATPIFLSRMTTSRIRKLDGEIANPESLRSKKLGAFCGLGNPESFFNHLRGEGLIPAFTRAFADHHNYDQLELDALVKEAKSCGARGLITTAKDAIKLATLNLELPCYVLEIQISIDDEERLLDIVHTIVHRNRRHKRSERGQARLPQPTMSNEK